jgi:succinate dehydrogenase (ubiquinone) flavoprotein subunit
MKGLSRVGGKFLLRNLQYGGAATKRRHFITASQRRKATTAAGGGLNYPVVDHHYE